MMSLAPQRPNFVLVWIGIILLTFSLISNFLAGDAGNNVSTADGGEGMGGRMVVEESSPLPNFFLPVPAFAEKADFTPGVDPLSLDSIPYVEGFDAPLAQQVGGTTTADKVEFPVELLEPAVEEELGEVSMHGGLQPQPLAPVNNHALRESSTQTQSTTSPVPQGATEHNSLKSTYSGADRGLHHAKKLRDSFDQPSAGLKVKASLRKAGSRNHVVVSFFVSHPIVSSKATALGLEQDLSAKALVLAREYMRAVEEAGNGSEEQGVEGEEDLQADVETQADSSRNDLLRLLRMHPDGIEIIAELTPAQLRRLVNKLDARS